MDTSLGKALLVIARTAIAETLDSTSVVPLCTLGEVTERQLAEPGAVFVTLKLGGDLRGCIGSLLAHRSLREDCRQNAQAAALMDTRFEPVTMKELTLLKIEVSLLSEPEPFPCKDEADACARLLPGEHGIIFTGMGRRATFLPQVWEQLPSPKEFLHALKRKAGLPSSHWGPDVRLEVYTVDHVEEE